ncbi:MAG TPA: hypothetical protein VGQ26_21095 [Streptosporangiaceae bacterium]|nr:hypothetical protein [Streptosporangiaceae bacterium]
MNQTMHRWLRRLLGFSVAVALAVPLSATASNAVAAAHPAENAAVISDWNATAMTTLAGDKTRAPQEWALYLAFMHAAMYDAVVGVEGRYRPYVFHDRAPAGASATAAAAAAAHKILETYEPYAQSSLDEALAASLAGIPDGTAKTDGVAFGERMAGKMIALRANDGRNAPVLFTKPPAPGVWRPTPPDFLPMAVPWLGGVTPLLVHSATQFGPPPPPALKSRRYARNFNEVKAVGSAASTVRTPGQTATAMFFSGNAFVQFNAALRDQAAKRGLDIVRSARMFAAVDMTVADALITTWRAKLFYGFWRPSTAIQLADTDGNPATAPDPTWTPLLVNPNYPDYVSGYNAFAASFSQALEEVVGRHLDLTLISTAVPGVTRSYDSGRALHPDIVDARVWLGIHFRFADVAARNLGIHLAEWTLHHYFQPVKPRG